jgi:hypothetical protein
VRTGENAPHNEEEAFMHPIIAKTLGGLSREYYLRQFVFGLIFPAITVFAFTHGTHPRTRRLLSIARWPPIFVRWARLAVLQEEIPKLAVTITIVGCHTFHILILVLSVQKNRAHRRSRISMTHIKL